MENPMSHNFVERRAIQKSKSKIPAVKCYKGCVKTFIDAGASRKHSHIHGEGQYVCHYEACGKVNTQAQSNINDCIDRNNSKYYVVVVQVIMSVVRLAPEEISQKLTGYEHNGVTCIGMKTEIPVILDEAIVKLNSNFFWLGGGDIDLKLGIRTSEFINYVNPFIVSCSNSTRMPNMSYNIINERRQHLTRSGDWWPRGSHHVEECFYAVRLAPEEISQKLTEYEHNEVTCIGMKTDIPVILDEAIVKLNSKFFWLGGGEIDLKLGDQDL